MGKALAHMEWRFGPLTTVEEMLERGVVARGAHT